MRTLLLPAAPMAARTSVVVAQVGEPLGQTRRIVLRHDEAGHSVADELRIAAAVAADDRESQGHVLHDRVAESLAGQPRVGHEDADVGVAHEAEHLHPRLREDHDASRDQVARGALADARGRARRRRGRSASRSRCLRQAPRDLDDEVVVLHRRHAAGHHDREAGLVRAALLAASSSRDSSKPL